METTMYTVGGKSFELRHYGVKGMKWGVRRKRRDVLGAPGGVKGGPYDENKTPRGAKSGPYGENKTPYGARSLSRKNSKPYVQDLGGGVTANWPSEKAYRKAEKKRFKADVKDFKKNGFNVDWEIDQIGQFKVTQYYNSKQQKLGREYAERVIAQAQKDNVRNVMGTTAAVIGASVIAAMLESR